jgi:hypothetical protein
MATSNAESVARDLAWREGVSAKMTPAVFWKDTKRGAWVEELLTPVRAPDVTDITKVLESLRSNLYSPNETSFETWHTSLLQLPSSGVVKEALDRLGKAPVPIWMSIVHGDVNPGNLYPLADGRVLIGDWEYARSALATYDVWIAARFWRDLSFPSLVGRLFDEGLAVHAEWLEVAHRIEWYTTLQALTPGRANGLMAELERELHERLQRGFK